MRDFSRSYWSCVTYMALTSDKEVLFASLALSTKTSSGRSWWWWWCGTRGLEMWKTLLESSKYYSSTWMILEYLRVIGTQTSTWHPKTNWGHISNEHCDDIGNGVLVNDAYDSEKDGVLLWDCLFCLRKSVITIPESGASLPYISLRNKPGWNISVVKNIFCWNLATTHVRVSQTPPIVRLVSSLKLWQQFSHQEKFS